MAPEVVRKRTTAQATEEGLRIFVAGVPWKITEEVLRKDFEECGVVEDMFLLRDSDGNSRGRAFITFQEASAVEAALKYDNTEYAGRKIFVKVAEAKRKAPEKEAPKERTKDRQPRQAPEPKAKEEFPNEKPEGCTSICVKNIGAASEDEVREFLAKTKCSIQSVRIVLDRVSRVPRGICFVDFPTTEDVDKAMTLDGETLEGAAVSMRYEAPRARPRPDGCLCVAVKKLGPRASETDIRELFRGLESLDSVRVIRGSSGECSGLAFAEFAKGADVEAAVKRDGMAVQGQTVFICYETKPKKTRPKPQADADADVNAEPAVKPRKAKKTKVAEVAPDGKEPAAGGDGKGDQRAEKEVEAKVVKKKRKKKAAPEEEQNQPSEAKEETPAVERIPKKRKKAIA